MAVRDAVVNILLVWVLLNDYEIVSSNVNDIFQSSYIVSARGSMEMCALNTRTRINCEEEEIDAMKITLPVRCHKVQLSDVRVHLDECARTFNLYLSHPEPRLCLYIFYAVYLYATLCVYKLEP